MKTILRSIVNHPKFKLYLLLNISAIVSCSLLAARIIHEENTGYIFLAWNLFLGAIPLMITMLMHYVKYLQKNTFLFVTFSLCWLLFFPNAPYIITDILHFRYNDTSHAWYDLMMLMMFSWTGLIAGFVSLDEMQQLLRQRFSSSKTSLFVIAAIVLASFGVYMGRFLRWNSWDILRHPGAIAKDIFSRILNPIEHPRAYAVTIVLSLFMLIAYYTIKQMRIMPINKNDESH